MPSQQPPDDLLACLRTALDSKQLNLWNVWLAYFSLGGNADSFYLDAYIHELISVPSVDRLLLEQACRDTLNLLT